MVGVMRSRLGRSMGKAMIYLGQLLNLRLAPAVRPGPPNRAGMNNP